MKTIVLSLLILSLSFTAHSQIKLEDGSPQYREDGILIEANDAGEKIILPYEDQKSLPVHHRYFHFRKSFEEVAAVITPEVEDAFDLFIFANVSYEKYGSPNDYIPSQRMRIFRKKNAKSRIFNRNLGGDIIPYNPVSSSASGVSDHDPALPGLPGEILISSGAKQLGPDYVDTFSGVFRLNHTKSKNKRYGEGMIHSLYVDVVYPHAKNRASGIAVHGTPKANYKKLGQQASHGCVRIHQDVALPLYEYALGEPLFDEFLLDFSQKERLPPAPLKDPRPGQKVLMVFFYGYDGNPGLEL